MKIVICLAAYNGEKYLAAQLDSVLAQTFGDWRLLIRDDGSTDGTREIIRRYAARDGRIRWIEADRWEHIGFVASFHRLVLQEAADFYFFCDQDDVWLPEKLALTLSEAAKYDATAPLMIFTDLRVVDQELALIRASYLSQNHAVTTSLRQQLTTSNIVGAVSCVNAQLAGLWTTDDIFIHDWYLGLLAAAFGRLVYLDVATELYRQHGGNVSGGARNAVTLRTLSERLRREGRRVIADYWRLYRDINQLAAELLRTQGDKLSRDKKALIEHFVGLYDRPLPGRLWRLMRYRYGRKSFRATALFVFLYLTGFGKKASEAARDGR